MLKSFKISHGHFHFKMVRREPGKVMPASSSSTANAEAEGLGYIAQAT